MENNNNSVGNCRSIYKNGRPPTKDAYTQVWIKLINQIEKRKAI